MTFLSKKNYVNVPSKSNKQKNWKKYDNSGGPLEVLWQKEQDPDPDSLVWRRDSRIRIRTKMSRIRNIEENWKCKIKKYVYPNNFA